MPSATIGAAMKYLHGLYDGKVLEVTPFHNDPNLQRFVKGMLSSGLEAFIETGTFRGDTLIWVAREFPGLPCLSCESSKIFYAWARARVRARNARIYLADSKRFLTEHVDSYYSALFWLDAHWGENWPILDEMRIIIKSGVKGVALIDDFDIGKEGFGYDSFRGHPLNSEYLRPPIERILVPNYKPGGDYRGYVIIPLGLEVPDILATSYEYRNVRTR